MGRHRAGSWGRRRSRNRRKRRRRRKGMRRERAEKRDSTEEAKEQAYQPGINKIPRAAEW